MKVKNLICDRYAHFGNSFLIEKASYILEDVKEILHENATLRKIPELSKLVQDHRTNTSIKRTPDFQTLANMQVMREFYLLRMKAKLVFLDFLDFKG